MKMMMMIVEEQKVMVKQTLYLYGTCLYIIYVSLRDTIIIKSSNIKNCKKQNNHRTSSRPLSYILEDMSGSVYLDVINQTWSPMFDLVHVTEVFVPQLLLYPNPSDPLNGETAALVMRYQPSYGQRVK
ncbi:unnamed protein product [Cuscuta epithymum]|uniref:UBC core domain-containing protein n=1 Tax=Cuscuta epithymum TaxID=186058 RepID=A0AAV0CE72_9ASTE|nr:unnamed protein product [Cuscuta epithymum]